MCKAVVFHKDHESVESGLKLIRTWMKDNTSIVALSPTTGRVIGIAVTRPSSDPEKSDIYGRVQVHDVT